MTSIECKACKTAKDPLEFYVYKNGRIYSKCKRCHNKTRNNYARNKPEVRTPGGSLLTMFEGLTMQTPDGTYRQYTANNGWQQIFDFVNRASDALCVQTDVGTSNTDEVKLG